MRVVLAGACSALATLAGTWLASPSASVEAPVAPTEIVDVPTIAAPLFRDGAVQGYFLIRVAVEIGERAGAGAALPPRAVLADAVLAHVFANPHLAFETPDGLDLERLRDELRSMAETSIGAVRRLYITQVDFLSKADIRNNALGRRPVEGVP